MQYADQIRRRAVLTSRTEGVASRDKDTQTTISNIQEPDRLSRVGNGPRHGQNIRKMYTSTIALLFVAPGMILHLGHDATAFVTPPFTYHTILVTRGIAAPHASSAQNRLTSYTSYRNPKQQDHSKKDWGGRSQYNDPPVHARKDEKKRSRGDGEVDRPGTKQKRLLQKNSKRSVQDAAANH